MRAVKDEKTSICLLHSQALSINEPYIVVNINSEAVSRRMPVQRAALLIEMLAAQWFAHLPIGSAKEKIMWLKLLDPYAILRTDINRPQALPIF